MATKDITAGRVRELLNYDPHTGILSWRIAWGKMKPGMIVACRSKGHLLIGVEGTHYQAHRIAWLHYYGQLPKQCIDHIDGDRANNAISNLRDAGTTINMQNKRAAMSTSKLGVLGVSEKKETGRFSARITANGKRWNLGYYDTPEEAFAVYLAAKRRLHQGCTI